MRLWADLFFFSLQIREQELVTCVTPLQAGCATLYYHHIYHPIRGSTLKAMDEKIVLGTCEIPAHVSGKLNEIL